MNAFRVDIWPLSLCLEDVKAQCDSLTPQTRERLQGILSQREVDTDSNVSVAHAHGYLKISRNPLLRVHRNVPVRSETIDEPETDPFSGPADPCDSVTDELDFDPSVSKTRKCRRLLHKSLVSARFSLDDCDEDDDTSAQVDCFMPALAENFDEKRLVVGTVCSTDSEGDSLPAAMETTGQSDEIEFDGHEHTVPLLEKGGAGVRLPTVFETDDTTTESCQQGKFLEWPTCNGTRRLWERGKDETSPA